MPPLVVFSIKIWPLREAFSFLAPLSLSPIVLPCAVFVNLGSEAPSSTPHTASSPLPGPSTIVTAPILGPRPIHPIWPRFALFWSKNAAY